MGWTGEKVEVNCGEAAVPRRCRGPSVRHAQHYAAILYIPDIMSYRLDLT